MCADPVLANNSAKSLLQLPKLGSASNSLYNQGRKVIGQKSQLTVTYCDIVQQHLVPL